MKHLKIFMFFCICFIVGIINVNASSLEIADIKNIESSPTSNIIENNPIEGDSFDITFKDVNSYIKYEIILKNTIEEDIIIDNIDLTLPSDNSLKYSYESIFPKDIIPAGETKTFYLVFESTNIDNIDGKFIQDVNFKLNYSSIDKEEKEIIENPKTGIKSFGIISVILILSVFIGYFIIKNKYDFFKKFSFILLIFISLLSIIDVFASESFILEIKGKIRYQKEFVVTIDPNGGLYNGSSDVQTFKVLAGEKFNIDEATRNLYDFVSWEINPSNIKVNNQSIVVTSNINLKALWNEQYFKLIIDPNGGMFNGSSSIYETSVRKDDVIDLSNINRIQAQFVNWIKDDNEDYSDNTITIKKDTTLKAIWNVNKFKITVDPNGGMFNGSDATYETEVEYGTEVDLSDIVNDNHLFGYWKFGESVFNGNLFEVLEDTTLVAQWDPIICRIDDTMYSSIMKAHEKAVTGDTIVLLVDTKENVINEKNITLDLNQHTVTGNLINTENGNITIINGTILNPNGTVITNNGVLTLGIDNDTINSKDCKVNEEGCVILLGKAGIEQNKEFNFYDGYIKADIGLIGGYNKSPFFRNYDDGSTRHYHPFIDRDVDLQYVYLSEADRAITKTVTNGEIYYFHLQDNINTSIRTGYKIYAVRDFEAAYPLSLDENESSVIDISGYNVSFGNDFTNNGDLIITDSSETRGLLNLSNKIINSGNLSFKDINVKTTTTSGNITNNSFVKLDNTLINTSSNNNVIVNKKDIELVNSRVVGQSGHAISAEGGTIKMDDKSSLTANTHAIQTEKQTTNSIIGGTINGIKVLGTTNMEGVKVHIEGYNDYPIYTSTVTLNVNDCIIDANRSIFYLYNNTINVSNSKITVTNGALSHSQGSYSGSGNLVLRDNDITMSFEYGNYLFAGYNYNVHIHSGTINATGINKVETSYREAIYMYGGELNITSEKGEAYGPHGSISGGKIVVKGKTNGYGVYGSSTTITGGYIYGSTYGAWITSNGNIGTNDETLSTTSPEIVGEVYGLYSQGTNVYDGIFKGKTKGYSGLINQTPDATEIHEDVETIEDVEYKTAYLVTQNNFLKIGDTEYNSLLKALRDVPDNTQTKIDVFDNGKIPTDITISASKNIVLDFNGYTLTTGSKIINNGILTIQDSSESETGMFVSNVKSTDNAIENNKELYVNGGTLKCNSNNSTNTRVILNKATLEVNSATIEGKNAIYHQSASMELKIADSVIKATYSGLYLSGPAVISNSDIIVKSTEGYNQYYDLAGITTSKKLTMTDSRITMNANHRVYGIRLVEGSNVTTDNVTIEATSPSYAYGIYGRTGSSYNDRGYGYISVNNSTIKTTSNNTYGSGIFKTAISFNNSHIESSGDGISSCSGNLVSGTIKAERYGIYGELSSYYVSSFNIGKKDRAIDNTKLEVISSQYALYNNNNVAVFNYYDGVLKSVLENIHGSINEYEIGALITKETETIDGTLYNVSYPEMQEDFLEVNGETFNSFTDALESITDKGKITLIRSVIVGENITIPSTKDIELDLNSYQLDLSTTIVNNGRLVLNDSSDDANGTLNFKNNETGIKNNKELIFENGNYNATSNVFLLNKGTSTSKVYTTIKNGNLYASKSFIDNNCGELTINGGRIDFLRNSNSSGKIILNDGLMVCERDAGDMGISYGEFEINGGSFRYVIKYPSSGSTSYGLYSLKLTMTGGDIYIKSNSNIMGAYYGITANISGGKIECVGGSCFSGPYSSVNMSGGEVISTSIAIAAPTVITGGKVKGGSYGIYTDSITIGKKDGKLEMTPEIKGDLYAVHSTSNNIKYYDGVLIGKTPLNEDFLSDIEPNATIMENTEDDYYMNYPEFLGNIALNNRLNKEYEFLNEAINEAESGDKITILKDAILNSSITVPNDKNIILDFNGHKISNYYKFTNNGEVQFINKSDSEATYNSNGEGEGIINNNILSIDNVSFTKSAGSFIILNNSKLNINKSDFVTPNGIYNKGDLVISNSTGSYQSSSIGIRNEGNAEINNVTLYFKYDLYEFGNGKVTINNSTFTTTSYSIYNYSNNEINVNNSSIISVFCAGGKTVNIDGGTANGYFENYGTLNISNNTSNGQYENKGTLTFDNVTINHSDSNTTLNNTSTMKILNTTITKSKYANIITNTGYLEITDSTLASNNNACSSCSVIRNEANSSMNYTNSTIEVSGGDKVYGIYNRGNNSEIISGSILIQSKNAYGIYIESGSMTLGEKESSDSPNYGTESAKVSVENPMIKAIGSASGIGIKKVGGYLNYYDGIIIGSTSAKPDTTSDVEYNYEATTSVDSETGYSVCILEYLRN